MAVWQASLKIVRGDQEEDWQSWANYSHLCTRLDALLKPSCSWHKDLQTWGEGGGHEVSLWKTHSGTGSFLIRIDLRDDFFAFVNSISDLLDNLDLKIYQEDSLIAPTTSHIYGIVKSSKAFRFVQNPRAYLEELARNLQ